MERPPSRPLTNTTVQAFDPMHPYLHILIQVKDDGSLHALGAFTSKAKQRAYQVAAGLTDNEVRLDFYNGPFAAATPVIYAGHRRWNMDRFQLAGYFNSEGDAWNQVSLEGYVSVLQIDISYEAEKQLEQEALELYAQLQKRWRLSSYEELIAREGAEKARANIMLRFYEDALESFKPKTARDVRALYAAIILALIFPLAVFFSLSHKPDYGENVTAVNWLPDYTSDISYYRSKQVQVYEFKVSAADFKRWAENSGMRVQRVMQQKTLSRYKAYLPSAVQPIGAATAPTDPISKEQFQVWQQAISVQINHGLIAHGANQAIAAYDLDSRRAYFENLAGL
jgi:hypothetical protein